MSDMGELKVTFTADMTQLDAAAKKADGSIASVEANMEAAAATAATASATISKEMAAAASAVGASSRAAAFGISQVGAAAAATSATVATELATAVKSVAAVSQAAKAAAVPAAGWGTTFTAAGNRVKAAMATAASAVVDASARVAVALGGTAAAAGQSAVAVEKAAIAHEAAGRRSQMAWAAAVLAIGLAIRKVVSDTLELDKIAQATGIGVNELGKLKYAVEQSGVSFSALSAAAKAWGGTVNEMATDPVSKASQAFKLMGIDVKDASGRYKDFVPILLEVSDKLSGYRNCAAKSALATATLKETGEDLIPFLNKTSAGIQALTDKAGQFGGELNETTIKKVKEFDNALKDLVQAIKGVALDNAGLLTWLKDTATLFGDSVEKTKIWARELNERALWEAFKKAGDEVAALNKRIEEGPTLTDKFFGRDLPKMFAEASARLDDIGERLRKIREEDKKAAPLGGDIGKDTPKPKPTVTAGDWQTTVNKAPSTAKTDAPDLNSLKLMKDDLDSFIRTLDGVPVLFEKAFSFDSTPFVEAMDRVNKAEAAGAISAKTAADMRRDLHKKEQGYILDTASLAASTLTTVFGKSKLAAAGAAVINTAVGITKAMEIPAPYSWIQAGLIAASGVAQLAAIRSASADGGGSAPTVNTAAAAAPTAPTAGNQDTLFVKGLRATDMLSGEYVSAFAKKLLQYQADGGRVILG